MQSNQANDILQFINHLELDDNLRPILSYFKNLKMTNDSFICGGAIRNFLLGNKQIKDIDIFIDVYPSRFIQIVDDLKNYGVVEFGQYGSPRLFPNNCDIYIDIIPFYNFIVSKNSISSINDLLLNFDITANAIGIKISTHEIYNPVNGIQDIQSHILKAVRLDFPEKNVSNTIQLSAVSVFLFRLLHYQNVLNFSFDLQTFDWIIANAYRWKDFELMEKYFFKPLISEKMYKVIESHVYKQKVY